MRASLAILLLVLPAYVARTQQPALAGESPAAIFANGAAALQAGRLPEAERCFRRVSELDPASSSAFVNLGVTEMREKQLPAALESLAQAKRLALRTPGMPESQLAGIELNLGLAHYRSGSYTEAASAFRRAVAIAPANTQANYLLGISCFLSDDYAGSVAALEPLWSAQATNLNYLYVLAEAAGKVRQSSLEERALRQMSSVGAGSAALHLYMGKAMLAREEYSGAVDELQQALALAPSLPMANFFLAEALRAEHHDSEAAQALKTEIALEPDVPYSYGELGQVESLLGHPNEAEQAYRSAIAHDASLSNAYVGLAGIYRDQRRDAEALAMLDRAVQLRPRSGSVHYLRAQVLKSLHQNKDAAAEFAQAATLLHQVNDNLQQSPDPARRAEADQMEAAAQL